MAEQKILVIDDDPVVAKSCHRVLTAEGYKVDTALSAQNGLERALQNDFDLVITDLRMPDLDGMEVVRRIAGEKPFTPVVVITGYGTIQSAVEATKLGAHEYVEKPFTPELLLQVVDELLKVDEEKPQESREARLSEYFVVREALRAEEYSPGYPADV